MRPFEVLALLSLALLFPTGAEAANFSRGDANADGQWDLTDVITLLGFQFLGEPSELACPDAGDVDDSGEIDISDAINLLGFLFLGNAPPPPPNSCGTDPTSDSLDCPEFGPCPASSGPTVTVLSPASGGWIEAAAGSTIPVSVEIESEGGNILSVLINGIEATSTGENIYSASIPVRYGINFIDIVAVESGGGTSHASSSFLAATSFLSEDALLVEGMQLDLQQEALDDGNRSDPIDDVNDLVHGYLNSPTLRDTLHAQLSASPVLKDSCDTRDPIFGACLFSSRVEYRNIAISNVTSSLAWVNGGLRTIVNIGNLNVQVRVDSTAFDGTGWARFSNLRAEVTSDLTSRNGQAAVNLRAVDSVTVDSIDLDFPGVGGFIIDILQGIFQGTLRNLVIDVFRDFLRDNIPDLLDEFFSTLSIDETISMSLPWSEDTLNLQFSATAASASASASRGTFGLSTRLSSDEAHARPTPGIALPATASSGLPTAPLSLAISTGTLNQIFHVLWRAGFLDGSLTGDLLGVPGFEELSADLQARLPPVIEMRTDGEVALMLGALDVTMNLPGIPEPLEVRLGAVATTDLCVTGGNLCFDGITLEETRVSILSEGYTEEDELFIQALVISLLELGLESLLTDSLGAIPIPSFGIPGSITAPLGLDPDAVLSISNPELRTLPAHVRLDGRFRVR